MSPLLLEKLTVEPALELLEAISNDEQPMSEVRIEAYQVPPFSLPSQLFLAVLAAPKASKHRVDTGKGIELCDHVLDCPHLRGAFLQARHHQGGDPLHLLHKPRRRSAVDAPLAHAGVLAVVHQHQRLIPPAALVGEAEGVLHVLDAVVDLGIPAVRVAKHVELAADRAQLIVEVLAAHGLLEAGDRRVVVGPRAGQEVREGEDSAAVRHPEVRLVQPQHVPPQALMAIHRPLGGLVVAAPGVRERIVGVKVGVVP
mmetsp:Transcript_78616/g.230682  ORF Transcript_78616/g.230682 Transcript_78616/m.230682 type:complete len:256 (+) Transcript_78616:582-1349(+)